MPETGVKPGVEAARQYFLYGDHTGKRVLNATKLAELSDLHISTIRRHLAKWQQEHEDLLANTNESTMSLSLSKDVLDAHKKDLLFIRDKMNCIQWEVENLSEIIAGLEDLVDRITRMDDADQHDISTVLAVFNAYISSSANRKTLLGLFLNLKKAWDAKAGIDTMIDVQATGQKEISKGKAKLDLKKLSSDEVPRDASPAGQSVFRRREQIATRDVVDEEDEDED